MAPQVMFVPARPLPTVFGQGCLWGLLQGALAGFLVAFTQTTVNFYLAILMGFCFYVIAGLSSTHRGGSSWRGFWTGFWSGIFSTLIFWIVYGVGYAIRLSQRLQLESRAMPGVAGNVIFNRAVHSVHTALPPSSPSSSSSNLPILLGGGLLLAALLGWLGGLLGRSWYRARIMQSKQRVPHP